MFRYLLYVCGVEQTKRTNMKIKTGDTVRCVAETAHFTVGKEYKVLNVDRSDVMVIDDTGAINWFRPTFLPFELM